MYFPWNWEFGSALSKLQNFGAVGGLLKPLPLQYATAFHANMLLRTRQKPEYQLDARATNGAHIEMY
jgi:hypothetical protein